MAADVHERQWRSVEVLYGHEWETVKVAAVGDKDHVVLTDNPDLAARVLVDGPRAFDNGDKLILMPLVASSHNTRLSFEIEAKDDDLVIVHRAHHPIKTVRNQSPISIVHDVQSRPRNDLNTLHIAMISYGVSRAGADWFFSAMGRRFHERAGTKVVTYPLPSAFEKRLADAKEKSKSEFGFVFVPDFALFDGGNIEPVEYLEAWKKFKYPIGTGSFFHYVHDLSPAHLDALFRYGFPLMEVLSAYSDIALTYAESDRELFVWDPHGDKGWFKGKDVATKAAGVVDRMTGGLGGPKVGRGVAPVTAFWYVCKTLHHEGRLTNTVLGRLLVDRGFDLSRLKAETCSAALDSLADIQMRSDQGFDNTSADFSLVDFPSRGLIKSDLADSSLR